MAAVRVRSLPQRDGTVRYPVVGGVAALGVPFLTGLATWSAIALVDWDVALVAATLGAIAYRLWRNAVVEVSPVGLTRGFLLRGVFLGRATVIPRPAVREVHTRWCRPRDDSALETIVRGRDGVAIRVSTRMGLGAYFACLAAVISHAPGAARTGLTDAALADGPPTRRDIVSAAATAGTLSLVLLVLVSIFWAWGQGRSYLSRYLEEIGAVFLP